MRKIDTKNIELIIARSMETINATQKGGVCAQDVNRGITLEAVPSAVPSDDKDKKETSEPLKPEESLEEMQKSLVKIENPKPQELKKFLEEMQKFLAKKTGCPLDLIQKVTNHWNQVDFVGFFGQVIRKHLPYLAHRLLENAKIKEKPKKTEETEETKEGDDDLDFNAAEKVSFKYNDKKRELIATITSKIAIQTESDRKKIITAEHVIAFPLSDPAYFVSASIDDAALQKLLENDDPGFNDQDAFLESVNAKVPENENISKLMEKLVTAETAIDLIDVNKPEEFANSYWEIWGKFEGSEQAIIKHLAKVKAGEIVETNKSKQIPDIIYEILDIKKPTAAESGASASAAAAAAAAEGGSSRSSNHAASPHSSSSAAAAPSSHTINSPTTRSEGLTSSASSIPQEDKDGMDADSAIERSLRLLISDTKKTFVTDFIGRYAPFSAGGKSLSDYLSNLTKEKLLELLIACGAEKDNLENKLLEKVEEKKENKEIPSFQASFPKWDDLDSKTRWEKINFLFLPSNQAADVLRKKIGIATEKIDAFLKNIGKKFLQSTINIDDAVSTAFADTFNQHIFCVSDIFVARLPILAGMKHDSAQVIFDRAGNRKVYLESADNANIKITVKKNLGFVITTDGNSKETRSFASVTQELLFKRNSDGEAEINHVSTIIETENPINNLKINTLLFHPHANRAYGLQREVLAQIKRGEQDSLFNESIKPAFEMHVIQTVKDSIDCEHMDLSGVVLSNLDLRKKDFSHADLSGADLSGADLSGADLTGATLTDAIIDVNTKLKSTILPKDTSVEKITYRFKDDVKATIKISDLFKKLTEFAAKNKGLVLPPAYLAKHFGKNILRVFQFSEENPTSRIAEALNDVMYHEHIAAIQKSAKTPPEIKGTEKENIADSFLDYENEVKKKGLVLHQISNLIKHTQITVKGKAIDPTSYTARGFSNDNNNLPFHVYESDDKSKRVVNVGKTLCDRKYGKNGEDGSDYYIGAFDFARLLADLTQLNSQKIQQEAQEMAARPAGSEKKSVADSSSSAAAAAAGGKSDTSTPQTKNKKIDLIQMPLKAGNRDHYVQLQLYAGTDNKICARIIDSTSGLSDLPVDYVASLINENKKSLAAILGLNDSATCAPVEQVYTKEQLSLGDNKCGLYVLSGMQKAAEAVLKEGNTWLHKNDQVKKSIKIRHHVVAKTEPMGTLYNITGATAPDEEKASQLTAAEAAAGGGPNTPRDSSSSAAPEKRPGTPRSTADASSSAAAAPVSQGTPSSDNLSKPLLAKTESKSSDSFESIPENEAGIPEANKDFTDGYTRINTLLNTICDSPNFVDAVKQALTEYQKNRGFFKGGFFRQLSSAGKDYAQDASDRLRAVSTTPDAPLKSPTAPSATAKSMSTKKHSDSASDTASGDDIQTLESGSENTKQNKPAIAVAKQIAQEILLMGVSEDGKTLKVNTNSRVHHLLTALLDKKLIAETSDTKDMGFFKKSFNITDLKKNSAPTDGTFRPR